MLYHFASFQYQTYLDVLNIIVKYMKSLSSLEVEIGRWAKPNKVPYKNRKCEIGSVLDD